MIIEGLARENNLDSQIHTLPLKRGNGGYFALSFTVACGNRHETKIPARNYLVRVGTKFLHHSFKAKNGHAWEEVSMTVLMYPRLGASREEKKQGASSLTLLGRR